MTVERCDCCGRVKAAYWTDKGFCHTGRQTGIIDEECQAIADHMAKVRADEKVFPKSDDEIKTEAFARNETNDHQP